MKTRQLVLSSLVAAAFAASDADAVYLSPDGVGQALIFPYYTVQSTGGNAFNTLVSIRNQTTDSKVVKLRFREGRNSQEVMTVDLYLSPNDMWTGGLVPSSSAGAPARLVSSDIGCTDPPIGGGIDFRNTAYANGSDGAGTGLDRTREGFFEVFDMATISGVSATSISRDANGVPANCSAVQNVAAPTGLGAPSGGLSGTATLINVNNGMDFGMNAEALADLTKVQIYHPRAESTQPDFNAPEIDAISHVAINGAYYRSLWSRPVDAVSAVLMRTSWLAEYVLDRGSLSRTNIVMTFPTKRFYVTTTGSTPPFTSRFTAPCSASTGEPMNVFVFNREGRGGQVLPQTPPGGPPFASICQAASVATVARPGDTVTALGSTNTAFGGIFFAPTSTADESGWITIEPSSSTALGSLSTSTRTDFITGTVTTGQHGYRGLPVIGFWVRTFENGSLNCNGATCQGNYGSAFALTYRRFITP